MECMWNCSFWFIILFPPILLAILLLLSRQTKNRLPPGPKGWPILGNIFDIGTLPHRSLSELKQQYGPVVWLNLGSKKTMVLLTANAAAELYKKHDYSFLDRSIVDTLGSHEYHKRSMLFGPYGGYWRALKRLCTTELFMTKRINATKFIRQKSVNNILTWIEKEVGSNIELTKFVFPTLFNMVGNLVVSRDLVDPYSEMASEFYTAMEKVTECMGQPNVSDMFPWLRWLDLQGLRRKMDTHLGTALKIASGLVEERMNERQQGGEKRNDFLDALLDFNGTGKDEPAKLSKQDVSIFVLEMFLGGTETISTTVEWAMSELLRNPEMMISTKVELAKVVGRNNKLEENDINNLHYLQAVVKETLRLHPPGPLLIPKRATQDINFLGYNIPKDTQVLVNAWAIGRDPEYWADSLVFKPDRFLGSDVNFGGQHFGLIPFGSGRRTCVGLPLGHRMVHLILGSLIHEFEWELEAHATEALDMKETAGLTARKLEPLKAIPKKLGFKI